MSTAPAIRAATDVGGTFTDLVYFSTDRRHGRQEIVTAKADTTPPNFERGVLDVIAQGRRRSAGDRLPRPRHDRRHQRAHRAQGRRHGADHHRGVPRLAGDRARQPARLLQPLLRASRRRSCRAALRREVPGRLRQDGAERAPLDLERAAGDPRRLPRRGRRGGRDLPAALLREPGARAGRARARARAVAGGQRRRLAPDHARVARVRAHSTRRCCRRTSSRSPSATCRAARGVAARAGFDGQPYIMQSNCGVDTLEHVEARSRSRWSRAGRRAGSGARRSSAD